ncbi:MAG TPA: phage tail tape measure protein [Vicinamibacterales bacterium]|nr:phage tail tape measure protein [Vicinamibacterales bacterium]
MPSVLAALKVVIGGDISQFEKSMKQAERAADRSGRRLQEIGSKLMPVSAALALMGGASLKAAIDFESSFAGVRKTVDATEGEFAKLAQGFRDLAKTIPVNVNELNKIGEAAGQLGIKKENILGFTETIAALGVTTNLSTDQAATSLARLANITGLPQTQFSNLGSSIVALGNNFATTESEITEFGLRIAGSATLAKMNEPAIMGIGAAFSSVGVEAEAGGTAVQKVLNEMVGATAKGGKELEKFAAVAGMTAKEFQELFARDSAEAFTRFVEGLGKSGDKAVVVLDKLGLSDQRLVRAFTSVANAGDLMRRAIDTSTTAFAENTALQKEAEQRYKTTASQMTLLKNNVQDAAISFGQAFLPVANATIQAIRPMAGVLGDIGQKFQQLPQPIQATAGAIVGLGVAIGPGLWLLGGMQKAWAGVIGIFRFMPTLASGVSVAFVALARTLGIGTIGMTSAAGASTLLKGVMAALGPVVAAAGAAFAGWKLGGWIGEVTGATDWVGRLSAKLGEMIGLLPKGAAAQYDASRAAARHRESIQGVTSALDEQTAAMRRQLSGEDLAERLKSLENAYRSLTPEQQKSADTMNRTGEQAYYLQQAGAKLTPELQVLADAFAKTLTSAGSLPAGLAGAGDAADEFAKKLKALNERLLGVDVVGEAKLWAAAMKDPKVAAEVLANQTFRNEFVAALDAVIARFGSLKAKGLEALGAIHARAASTMTGLVFSRDERRQIESSFRGIEPRNDAQLVTTIDPRRGRVPFVPIPYGMTDEEFLGGRRSIWPAPRNDAIGVKGFLQSGFGSFKDFGAQLSGTVMSALTGGGNLGKSLGGLLGGGVGKSLVGSFTDKFAASKIGGLLGSVIPGLGNILGSVGGSLVSKLFGGLFGAKKKKEAKETTTARDQFFDQVGGLEKLKTMAESVDFSLSKMLSTKKPQEFKAEVDKLNAALEDKKKRWEGIQLAIEGVNARSAALLGPFERLREQLGGWKSELGGAEGSEAEGLAEKIANATVEMAGLRDKVQPEFERLGQFAAAAFAGAIRNGMTAMEAFSSLSPTFDALSRGVNEFGLQGTETIGRLLGIRDVITANEHAFAAIAANTQMMSAFGQAGIMTRDLFEAFGADVAAQLQKIAAGGGDMAQAMALSQPVLQQLWEAQQKYGAVTDESTAAMLRQAEEQGLVGAHMKSVNEKILDVLLAIGDAFGAKIPDSLRTFQGAAETAARSVERTFQNMQLPEVSIPIRFTGGGGSLEFGGGSYELPEPRTQLAKGGIVRRPTVALIGERGPEAVVPLDRYDERGGRSTAARQVNLVAPDGRTLWSWMLEQADAEGLA